MSEVELNYSQAHDCHSTGARQRVKIIVEINAGSVPGSRGNQTKTNGLESGLDCVRVCEGLVAPHSWMPSCYLLN